MNKADEINRKKVLYIDDEPNNLVSFKATFRTDYQVFIAISADEGLAVLKDNPDIQVILCDQRMPDKTGVQFFEETATAYPCPVRILLTGYTDVESVIKAINDGHIYRYITKPWQETDLRAAIEDGCRYYRTTALLPVKNETLQKAYHEMNSMVYHIVYEIHTSILSLREAVESDGAAGGNGKTLELLSVMTENLEAINTFMVDIHKHYSLIRLVPGEPQGAGNGLSEPG